VLCIELTRLFVFFSLVSKVQMMNPNGEAHPCNTSLPKHIAAGTPIRVQDLNPKAKASMSYARFDKYKSATTFKEMLDLGARRCSPGDNHRCN
jgi:hypothetical protein